MFSLKVVTNGALPVPRNVVSYRCDRPLSIGGFPTLSGSQIAVIPSLSEWSCEVYVPPQKGADHVHRAYSWGVGTIMKTTRFWLVATCAVGLALPLAGCATAPVRKDVGRTMTAGSGNRSDAKAQVEFGISVAQRGLWKEATQ